MPRLIAVATALLLAGCGTSEPEKLPALPPAPLAGHACLVDLKGKGASFTAMASVRDGSCVVDTPIRVKSLGIKLAASATMDCRLGERIWDYTTKVIEPAAEDIFDQKVASLRHFGSYSCRMSTGNRHQLSEHAYGLAFDLAGVVLADGSKITIEDDWDAGGKEERFLHRIAKEACRYFAVVLTPESNALHHNHLHLDIGPGRVCGPS